MKIYFYQQTPAKTPTNLRELESILGAPLAANVSAALGESKMSLADFASAPDTFIWVQGDLFLLAWMRDLCGIRMILLGTNIDRANLLRSDLFLMARRIARDHGCHYMQWAIPREEFENRAWDLPKGFFVTNLIFEKDLEEIATPPPATATHASWQQVQFASSEFQATSGDIEYWVRWAYPGSTYAPLDTASAVRAEYAYYPELAKRDIADGICHRDSPSQAYVIWIQNRHTELALIAMIWIHPEIREKVSGADMLTHATHWMKSRGMKTARYFVSAENIPAMKMLKRSGFQMKRYVINELL